MKELKLTNTDKTVLVDDDVFEWASQHHWQACSKTNTVNRCTMIDGKRKTVLLHRLINKTVAGMDTDHIDRNKLNNQRSNLRTANRSENCANRGKFKNGITSQFKGVHFDKRESKWVAQINVNKKRKKIGRFETEKEAALTYNFFARNIYGEFALLNNVNL